MTHPSISPEDLRRLESRGLSGEDVSQQIRFFQKPAPTADLDRPATPGDGILRFSDSERRRLVSRFEETRNQLEILKFVPASGAATRMFRDLQGWLNENPADEAGNPAANDILRPLLEGLEKKRFAFTEDLAAILASETGSRTDTFRHRDPRIILKYLLTDAGLNYSRLPKGLIKFHRYPDHHRTAIEEHLVEGTAYACGTEDTARLHFTVSPEHHRWVTDHIDAERGRYEREGMNVAVSLSNQLENTRTVAVDSENNPVRDASGRLLLRPGGHGALVHNLNDLHGDIIFIKNIDNVVPDRLKADTIVWKKILAGFLVELREEIKHWIDQLDDAETATDGLDLMARRVSDRLCVEIPHSFTNMSAARKRKYLIKALDRPVRVCGMVENEGEPGGGPFWVRDSMGRSSLQIIEKAQVNQQRPDQKKIFTSSTHFNPVDLVCSTANSRGKHFDLRRFIDPESYFITHKSFRGKPIRALEWPGLWNGAMAHWITLFVEVPLTTFNPVKTVYDLLRPQHREA